MKIKSTEDYDKEHKAKFGKDCPEEKDKCSQCGQRYGLHYGANCPEKEGEEHPK